MMSASDAHMHTFSHCLYVDIVGTYVVTAGRGFDSRWCHWKFSVT